MCNFLLSAIIVGAAQVAPDAVQIDYLNYIAKDDWRVQTTIVSTTEYLQCAIDTGHTGR